MLERDVIKGILTLLKDRGAWGIKIHGDPYQPKVVDILACYRGRFVAIEAKRDERQEPTAIQRRCLEQVREAGGWAIVAWKAVQVEIILNAIDMRRYSVRELGDPLAKDI